MRRTTLTLTILLGLGAATPVLAEVPVTLHGSSASMERQNAVAKGLDLEFVETTGELDALKDGGTLVHLEGNADYEVADFVGWPQARPEMKTFIERLAARYRAATGERLVVTSLIRPEAEQPANSHELSVHPTGMAVDLRVSQRAASREWLEANLLDLEERGVLDVTREFNPPHYHVAVFPEAYSAYLLERMALEARPVHASQTAGIGVANAVLAASRSVDTRDQTWRPSAAWALVMAALLGTGCILGRRFWPGLVTTVAPRVD